MYFYVKSLNILKDNLEKYEQTSHPCLTEQLSRMLSNGLAQTVEISLTGAQCMALV
jgi:hypothetical protein